MQIKSVLFGFGLGMVFLATVFLLAYRYENWRNHVVYEERATAFDDEEEMPLESY